MLGQALDAVRAEGKLSTLLAEMPAPVRADFMKTVQQSGDAKAQALVAKAVSNEMDRLHARDLGLVKYPLMATPGGGTIYLQDRARIQELAARQKELQQLLGTNTAATVRQLELRHDLVSVQRNLIQPPTEARADAVFDIAEQLKSDPAAAAMYFNKLAEAVSRLADDPDVTAAVFQGFSGSAKTKSGDAEAGFAWTPKPLIDALEKKGRQDLANMLQRFQGQLFQGTRQTWNWGATERQQFNEEQEAWETFLTKGRL
jgi:hypothetical protein